MLKLAKQLAYSLCQLTNSTSTRDSRIVKWRTNPCRYQFWTGTLQETKLRTPTTIEPSFFSSHICEAIYVGRKVKFNGKECENTIFITFELPCQTNVFVRKAISFRGDHFHSKKNCSVVDGVLNPVCELTATVETGISQKDLKFSWAAFKWATQTDKDLIERQEISCEISLSKDKLPYNIESCETSQVAEKEEPTEPIFDFGPYVVPEVKRTSE